MLGMKKLKIFSFGPRPQDFLACNAPIKPLYDLGVEIMENSELDLYDIFQSAKGDRGIKAVAQDMAKELGHGNSYPQLLDKLAQFEVALSKFMENNLGASQYGIFARSAGCRSKSISASFPATSIRASRQKAFPFPAKSTFTAR